MKPIKFKLVKTSSQSVDCVSSHLPQCHGEHWCCKHTLKELSSIISRIFFQEFSPTLQVLMLVLSWFYQKVSAEQPSGKKPQSFLKWSFIGLLNEISRCCSQMSKLQANHHWSCLNSDIHIYSMTAIWLSAILRCHKL